MRDSLIGRGLLRVLPQELILWKQPIVSLKTGEIRHEILVRHIGNFDSAQNIILGAERDGIMGLLDLWILESFVDYIEQSADTGRYSLNLSPYSINEKSGFELAILGHLAKLDSRLISLEITERGFVQWTPDARDLLARIQRLGFSLSLDDWGIGHPIVEIEAFQPAQIKIDGHFIKDLDINQFHRQVVKSTIEMAHAYSLPIEVVAEHVDNPEVFKVLTYLGCDWAQGYLLGRGEPLIEADRSAAFPSSDDDIRVTVATDVTIALPPNT